MKLKNMLPVWEPPSSETANSMNRTILLLLVAGLFLTGVASAQDYLEEPIDSPGTITGRVVLNGEAPAPLKLLITKDVEVCGLGYRERVEVDVDENNGLKNVVVFIDDVPSGKAWSEASVESSINQETCRFQPHIQVMRNGIDIDVINSDETLHNIHAYELIGRARKTLFNISQPEMGPIAEVMDPTRGNQISLECDSHDFMQGWIFVTDNPYATVVDEHGIYELTDVPAGTYQVSVWHPRLGIQTKELVVNHHDSTESDFVFDIE